MSAVDIPGYKILKTLGVGGQATVYLAIQTGFDRKVALKVMSPALAADPTFGERFLREAKIVAKLSHKSIVTVYDVGESGNFYYLAMEYLAGDDLKNRIEHGMKARECLRIISKLGRALHFAHEKGYVHRDVKSENILFSEDGEPLLTDFGIAKASNSSTQMTQTGKLIGTPEYMSPEQCRGKKIDGRSDIYSLGIILYEMLTRQVPYTGEDSVSVCIQHVTKPIPKLPQRLSHFQWLLDKMLAKDPAQRFQTGESLAEAVDKFRATGKPTEIIEAPLPKTKVTKPADSADDEDDLFEQFHNQRLVEDSALAPKSHLGRNVFFILLLIGMGVGGFTWERWLPQAQHWYAEISGQKVNAADSQKILANDSVSQSTSAQTKSKATDSSNESELLTRAEKQIAVVPRTLEQLKDALSLVDKVLQQNPQNTKAKLVRKNISATALEEASKAARLKDFNTANQWLNWVEFVDPDNALLAGTRDNITRQKTRYDGELLAAQQSAQALDNWLKEGDKALAENRLSAPAKNNAIYYYQQVLSKDPGNEKARQGISKIADKLEGFIQQAIAQNQIAKARRLLQRFEGLSADLEKQQQFKNDIAKAEQKWKQAQQLKEKQRLAEARRREKEKQRQQRLSDPAIQLRLQALIDSATSLQAEGAILEPAGNNAVEKYRAILKIDAQNEIAKQALQDLERKLVSETVTAISDGDKELAQIRLNKLKIFDENHRQIATLQQEIDTMIEPDPEPLQESAEESQSQQGQFPGEPENPDKLPSEKVDAKSSDNQSADKDNQNDALPHQSRQKEQSKDTSHEQSTAN